MSLIEIGEVTINLGHTKASTLYTLRADTPTALLTGWGLTAYRTATDTKIKRDSYCGE
jgi:hypothetical protein